MWSAWEDGDHWGGVRQPPAQHQRWGSALKLGGWNQKPEDKKGRIGKHTLHQHRRSWKRGAGFVCTKQTLKFRQGSRSLLAAFIGWPKVMAIWLFGHLVIWLFGWTFGGKQILSRSAIFLRVWRWQKNFESALKDSCTECHPWQKQQAGRVFAVHPGMLHIGYDSIFSTPKLDT